MQDPPQHWVSRRAAAARCQVSEKRITSWERDGTIKHKKIGNRTEYSLESLPSAPEGAGDADLVASAVGLLRQTHGHNERLIELFETGIKSTLESLVRDNLEIRKERSRMARDQHTMFETFQGSLSLQVERDIMLEKFRRGQQRTDTAMMMIVHFLSTKLGMPPHMVSVAMGGAGGVPDAEKAAAVAAYAEKVKAAQAAQAKAAETAKQAGNGDNAE